MMTRAVTTKSMMMRAMITINQNYDAESADDESFDTEHYDAKGYDIKRYGNQSYGDDSLDTIYDETVETTSSKINNH